MALISVAIQNTCYFSLASCVDGTPDGGVASRASSSDLSIHSVKHTSTLARDDDTVLSSIV